MLNKFKNYLKQDEKKLDIVEYLETQEPDLVSDINGLSNFLYSNRSQKMIGDFILASNLTSKYLEENRSHDTEKKISPYEIYKTYANKDYLLTKNDFQRYFKYINDIYLDTNELTINNKTVDSISSLINSDVPVDNIRNAYLKLCYSKNATIYDLWSNESALDEEIHNSHICLYRNFINSLNADINSILDFFSYLYLDQQSNDITLENIAILQKIINYANSIDSQNPILIILPSLFFAKKLFKSRYPFKNKHVYLAFEDEDLITLLNSKLMFNSKIHFISLSEINCLIGDINTTPSLSMIFANNLTNDIKLLEIIKTITSFVTGKHSYMLLIPNSRIFTRDKSILNEIMNTNINEIILYPAGILNSTHPQRKNLLFGEYGYIDNNNKILIKKYKLPRKRNDVLSGKTFNTSIDKIDLIENKDSLRKIFYDEERANETKTDQQRKQATIYKYSNEISIEYTKSGEGTKEKPYRIEAFVINPFGKRIENVSGSTKLLKDDSIENWLENEYLFSTINRKSGPISIRREISSVYVPYYLNKQITIKTLYYIHLELEDDLPSYTHNLIQEISNTYLSDIPINQISKDSLESFMELSMITNNYTYLQVLVVLSKLFNTGIEYGNCRRNPAQSLIKDRKEDNWGLKSIRSALTQKFFYSKQINQIINYASNLIKTEKDIGLGITILLRLYLGLETNFTSALLWKDLHLGDTPYLEINRQCKDRNLAFVNLDNPNQHIRTPLIKKILDILLKEKERQLKELANGDEKYLENCTIVYGTDIVIEDTMCVYSPYELNKKIRKLIIKVGMDEDIIVVPDTKNGTVETNLAYYPDDIFKFNYRHYILKLHPEIEAGQLFYLLGQKIPEDTLSNHYIGYGDEITINKLLQFQPDYEEVKK